MPAAKYIRQAAGRFKEMAATVVSAGAASDGAIVALDSTGKLDSSVLPTGIGAEVTSIQATEAISAGALVNVYNVSGAQRVRNADATAEGKEASGFVLSGVASGANAAVYTEGVNTQSTGLTPGARLYLATSSGAVTSTAPSTANNVSQAVGIALSPTSFTFSAGEPVTLA